MRYIEYPPLAGNSGADNMLVLPKGMTDTIYQPIGVQSAKKFAQFFLQQGVVTPVVGTFLAMGMFTETYNNSTNISAAVGVSGVVINRIGSERYMISLQIRLENEQSFAFVNVEAKDFGIGGNPPIVIGGATNVLVTNYYSDQSAWQSTGHTLAQRVIFDRPVSSIGFMPLQYQGGSLEKLEIVITIQEL